MVATQHSSEASDHTVGGGKTDTAGKKLPDDIVIALLMAILAAILLELLSQLLKHYGLVVETFTWLLAFAFLTVGFFLVHQVHQVIRGFGAGAGRLWFAVGAFLISTVLFVVAVPSSRDFDIVEYSSINWTELIKHAETEVRADGIVLDRLDTGTLIESLKRSARLQVQLVLLDPEGTVVQQRSEDENPKAPHDNPSKIREKIRAFQVARNEPDSGSWRDRFQLFVRNTYPTATVIVVDDELYAYFYPFREMGNQGPVFKFPHYKNSGPLGELFERHLGKLLDAKEGAYLPQDYELPCLLDSTLEKLQKLDATFKIAANDAIAAKLQDAQAQFDELVAYRSSTDTAHVREQLGNVLNAFKHARDANGRQKTDDLTEAHTELLSATETVRGLNSAVHPQCPGSH